VINLSAPVTGCVPATLLMEGNQLSTGLERRQIAGRGRPGRQPSPALTQSRSWPATRHEVASELQQRDRLIAANGQEIVEECVQTVAGGQVVEQRPHRSAASKPSSTHRMRTRSTVERLTSRAAAIASSLKRGPVTPSSAFNRMRACVSVRAAAFPFDSSSVNCARSSDVNFTRYIFIAPHFTGKIPSSLQCCLDVPLASGNPLLHPPFYLRATPAPDLADSAPAPTLPPVCGARRNSKV
jgi:hypothetical protein